MEIKQPKQQNQKFPQRSRTQDNDMFMRDASKDGSISEVFALWTLLPSKKRGNRYFSPRYEFFRVISYPKSVSMSLIS